MASGFNLGNDAVLDAEHITKVEAGLAAQAENKDRMELAYAVSDAYNDLKFAVRNLRSTMDSAARKLEREMERIDEMGWSASVNSLGVLQSTGPEIDRLAGVLDAKQGQLALVVRAYRAIYPDRLEKPQS